MRHKSCTQFSLFLIIRQNELNDGFQYPVLSAIILQLARWSSFKTAATYVMFLFVFVVPGLPLCSASSVDSTSAKNWLCHQSTIAGDTDESPNAFTNVSYIFAAVNPALQQNFIAVRCSKCFSMVIYNTSTKHTIFAKRSYTAAYRRIDFKLGIQVEKGLSNNFPNFYNDCTTSLDFRGTVSKLMGCIVYIGYTFLFIISNFFPRHNHVTLWLRKMNVIFHQSEENNPTVSRYSFVTHQKVGFCTCHLP